MLFTVLKNIIFLNVNMSKRSQTEDFHKRVKGNYILGAASHYRYMFGATFRSGLHLGTCLGLRLGPGYIEVHVWGYI